MYDSIITYFFYGLTLSQFNNIYKWTTPNLIGSMNLDEHASDGQPGKLIMDRVTVAFSFTPPSSFILTLM